MSFKKLLFYWIIIKTYLFNMFWYNIYLAYNNIIFILFFNIYIFNNRVECYFFKI